jgi:hypothetical protein
MLKSRGSSVTVSVGVGVAACVVPPLAVPVMVMRYVPPGVLADVRMLIVELNVGRPLELVNE